MKRKKNQYLIDLEQTRSRVALIAGILVFIFTISAIIIKVDTYSRTNEHPFHYFTVLSNFLSAIGAAFMIPYAAEGIRKKRFVLPRWVVLFQYAGATCVAITMVTTLLFIWPIQGSMAVTGTNFWLHIVTPFLTVVLFQCVETGIAFNKLDNMHALVPFWTYMIVYFIMVVCIGKDHGGWSDFYMATAYTPAWLSMLAMLILGYAVSRALRYIQNKHAERSWEKISALWTDDLDEIELLIESFGLGRSIGRKCSGSELTIPLDIFILMSKRYNIPLEKLTNAYVRGALDSYQEKQNRMQKKAEKQANTEPQKDSEENDKTDPDGN